MAQRYLVREKEVVEYHPRNHSGTVNRRLIGPGITTNESLEVVRGTIDPDQGAAPHRHPGIEQVCYLLSGRAFVTVDSESFEMAPGDCCYFPPGSMHSFEARGTVAAEVLVIYSPPYGERT